ncbi:MAG: hypothetical protein KH359_08100 [Clostridiales bacterium]|nr:hypothetical protein [Clostridiales bacterium]
MIKPIMNMNTDYTATRILGYLYRYSELKIEELVDEIQADIIEKISGYGKGKYKQGDKRQ